MQRIILHIDFDSFYASVEQQDNPLYRGRPLGVTATNGRTCIIAASREAKKLGIKSPSNTYDAKKICPSMIFIPAHFVRYFEISKIFLKICEDFSPTVEMFSLDEVFMDVTLTAKLFGGVDDLIARLKTRLRTEIGEYVTASVGISHNRMLAKMASGLKKPDGVMKITPENMLQVYASAKLTDICGIGYRINNRLNNLGIYNLVQLQNVSLSSLVAEFGQVEGNFLKNVGLGKDDSVVIPYSQKAEVKSVGRNYCLPHNEYDKRVVLQNVYELCEEIAYKLRKIGKKARTVGIYLGGSESVGGRLTVQRYINSGKEIFENCLLSFRAEQSEVEESLPAGRQGHTTKASLLKRSFDSLQSLRMTKGGYVRQIGIWTGNLIDAANVPAPLLPRDQKEEKLNTIIDSINEKFGDHTIRNGFLLYADKLTTVPNGYGASIRSDLL